MEKDFSKTMNTLADGFCERRAYNCLFWFLPAFYTPNGLTDGWEITRKALADTRAFCRDDLTATEGEAIERAINIIDRMLTTR